MEYFENNCNRLKVVLDPLPLPLTLFLTISRVIRLNLSSKFYLEDSTHYLKFISFLLSSFLPSLPDLPLCAHLMMCPACVQKFIGVHFWQSLGRGSLCCTKIKKEGPQSCFGFWFFLFKSYPFTPVPPFCVHCRLESVVREIEKNCF